MPLTTFRPLGRHAHPDAQLTPDQIRDYPLPAANWARGYARSDVRQLLGTIADQVRFMENEIDALWRRLDHREAELQHRRYGVALPADLDHTVPDDDMTLRWHIDAQRHSDDITAMAQRHAADIVEEARHQAEQVLAEIDLGTYEQAIAEVNRLRHLVAGIHRWMGEVRHYLNATHDRLSVELAATRPPRSGGEYPP
jgi:cell division septum initiation protein DivIVA